MKNASQKSWRVIAKMFLLATLLTPVTSGFSVPSMADANCPAPNVTKTGQTSTSISFSWDAVEGATIYKMWYVRREDNYTSLEITTHDTFITYSDLPAGNYRFYFQTICGEESSSYVMIDDLMM